MRVCLLADTHRWRQAGIAHRLRVRYVISAALIDEVVEGLWR